MNWMEDFLNRCLVGVPKGTYRDRVRNELRDHLIALERNLEGAYTPEGARALAKKRMGDPAELSQRYVKEWKRRSWPCRLFTAEFLLLGLCMSGVGVLYIINATNFGKVLVGYWGIAVIMANLLVLHGICGFVTGKWDTIRFCSRLLGVFQLPPLLCWFFYIPKRWMFEMSGVMVPGWAGFSVHLLFLLWSIGNYLWYAGYERETAGLWSVI